MNGQRRNQETNENILGSKGKWTQHKRPLGHIKSSSKKEVYKLKWYIKSAERIQINYLMMHIKNLEK